MKQQKEALSGADAKHGYPFGCNGVIDYEAAADRLGVSKRTVDRYTKKDRFRHGKHPDGKNVVCVRSLNEYISSLEK
ncbi:hypothetical protein [Gimesia sp.]|uniref:hypothetical protein n=1 Tax=Gimesia sp. TaxID=2024833 RepID=UPI003A8EC86A